MNAVIYARQSSGSDDYSESVETQIENCRKLAKRENLAVLGCFSDLNTSGKTYPEGAEKIAGLDTAFQQWFEQQTGTKKFRSGLGQVFRLLSRTDFLIVDEMTRLYRPVTRSFLESFVNQELAEHHVQILQCKGGRLDLSQFDQQLIQTLKNQIQDEAIANQKRKSREQFRKLRDAGYQCNGAKMFGIRYLGNRRLEVIPECAEVIRFVYDSVAAYMPYSAVIREVNTRFRHCFRSYFYESSLYSIIRQPIYCGYQYNSRRELIRNVQITGQEIVSYPLWQKVNAILDEKKRSPPVRAKKHWLPMSGRLICGGCGGRLTCQIDRGQLFYQCNKNNLRHDPACAASRIRFFGIPGHNGLYEFVYPILLIGLLERFRHNSELMREKDQLGEILAEIAELRNREQIVIDLFMANGGTAEQLDCLLRKHREKYRELTSRVRDHDHIDAAALNLERTVRLPEIFSRLRCRTLNNPEYEELFRDSIREIVVFRDKAEFHTQAGVLTIPRLFRGKRKFLPEWSISGPAGNIFGDIPAPVTVTFQTTRPAVLLTTDRLVFVAV